MSHTPQSPTVWCGIPVYNNAGTITDIARRCRKQLDHVLVVDDGSTDADLRDLLKAMDVTVIRHPTNLGKGKALLTAFQYAARQGAEYLITLDGDGQHYPEDLPRFFPHLSPSMIVIGYRDEVIGEMPRASQFGREFSDFWIRLEAGGFPRDTQSGFRAYPLAAVLQMQLNSHFYNFEMEIITRAMWGGLRVHNLPIRVWYPPAEARVSSFDPVRDNARISLLHLRLILRQLMPIPHRRLDCAVRPLPTIAIDTFHENSSPLGLAVSAGLSILMGIVLWPWGLFAVVYVTIRLHLNKIIAVLGVAICMPTYVPIACMKLGRMLVQNDARVHWQWIIGTHIVAIPLALLAGWAVFMTARRHEKKTNLTMTS